MRAAHATITALLFVAGCGKDVAGPSDHVLVGQLGSKQPAVVLLATHASAELTFPCNAYFVSTSPLKLAADGTFDVRGDYHSGGNVVPTTIGATLRGTALREDNFAPLSATITMVLDNSSAAADPFTATVVEGVNPDPQVCPL